MQRTGGEFETPSPLGDIEAEFMFGEALGALANPEPTSVDIENAFIDISGLNLSPIQSRRLLETASKSADQWLSSTREIEPIESAIFPYLTSPSNDTQIHAELLPVTTAILGRLLAVDPELYQTRWRTGIIRGRFGNPDETLTGLLSRVTSQEYLEEHDLDPIADDYVDLVKSVLKDVKSQGNDDLTDRAKATMSSDVVGALAMAEMQKPIPEREILTAQAIVAMVTVYPESFTEGVERRVLAGEYGDPEEVLSGIISSVSSKVQRLGYDGPDSPDSLTMAIVFDDLLTTSPERARELMPVVVESPWYWDRYHSFSYNVLQALDVAGIPVGEEEGFISEHAMVIEAGFKPTLDHKALEQISRGNISESSRERTYTQRLASVIRTIRGNEFFRQVTLDADPFEKSDEYPYIPDNVIAAGIRSPEGFAQLPSLEAVAPELARRLKNPKPLEERNSGIIRDMLAAEKPLETAIQIQAKLSKKKAKDVPLGK